MLARLILFLSLVSALFSCGGQRGILSPVPITEGYFAGAGGTRLFYRAVGTGPDTVVVLHGSPGHHMGYLLPDLLPLARGRTLLFYDQRGGGRSQPVTDTSALRVENHIEDLEALRRHFRLEQVALLGHSWGGGLAVMYGIRYSDRVSRMLLLAPMSPVREPYSTQAATAFFPRLDSATWKRLAALEQSLATAEDPIAVCREIMRSIMAAPVYFADSAGVQRYRGDFCDAPPESLRTMTRRRDAIIRSRGNWDLRAEASTLRVPTLIIHGDRDALPLEGSREWARVLPNARLLAVPGADHYLHAEKAEVVLSAADQFFRGKWPEQTQAVQ